MAAYTIATRAILCGPDFVSRSVSSSSEPLQNTRAVSWRRKVCPLLKGVRCLDGAHLAPIGLGYSAPSGLLRRGFDHGDKRNGTLVNAEGENRGRESNRDENGVIKDMELYLDDLSLEYDSVWDTKPAWCQPWTIVTTGVAVISGSWLLFENIFVTGGVCFVIGVWWFSFLYAYPLAYTEMIAERRKSVKNGDVDTFGTSRSR